jgi:gentisate 1,2-dioxygenase
VSDDRNDFSAVLARFHVIPLWEHTMQWRNGSAAVPALWHWQDIYPHLLRAAKVVGTAQAERRVLQFRNPVPTQCNSIAPTLVAGLQILLGGETARMHRHSPSALRFVIWGRSAYTTVEGERVAMSAGDLVITPAWCWHEHGNAGSEPVIWLDGLDAPLASLLGAWRFEAGPPGVPEPGATDGAQSEVVPAGIPADRTARTLRYPYDRTVHALACLQRQGEADPAHGYRLRYIDPASGRDPLTTMAIYMQRLPARFHGMRVRSTDSAVYCVVEDNGRVETDTTELAFGPDDIFVIPSWHVHRFVAESACVLFGFSDRAAQEALGLWREAR